MSKTASPEPVASAILASGHFVHHRLIVASSSVASLNPPLVRGCFPALRPQSLPQLQQPSTIEWQGKIRQCIREYASAASSFTLTSWAPCLMVLPVLSRDCGSYSLGRRVGDNPSSTSARTRGFCTASDTALRKTLTSSHIFPVCDAK